MVLVGPAAVMTVQNLKLSWLRGFASVRCDLRPTQENPLWAQTRSRMNDSFLAVLVAAIGASDPASSGSLRNADMKTNSALLVLALLTSIMLPGFAADEKDKLNGAKCLLAAKNPAKADKFVEYRGAKIYFCCDNCPKAYEKDKAKFATKANHQLALTGQAKQEKCPLSGQAVDKGQTVDIANVKVSFCCGDCKGQVEKAEGDAKLELAFADKAFDKGFKVEKKK